MGDQHTLKTLRLYLIITVLAVPVFSVVVGDMLTAGRTPDFVFTVKIALMAALFSLVAIPTFLSGLRSFKSGLKKSYILLAIGIGIFGLAQFQIPAVNLTGWWVWLDSGLAGFVYLVSVIPMLLGMRQFARLLNVKTRWSSIWLCIASFAVISVVLAFVPHLRPTDSEVQFRVFITIVVWSMLVMLFSGMLALKIRAAIAQAYKKSLLWLAITFFVLMFGGAHFIMVYYLFATGDWYFDYSFTIVPFVVGGLLFIKAGYEFNAVGHVLSEGEVSQNEHPQPTAQEVVAHVAALASNPSDIDAIMDDMRVVTSHIEAGQGAAPVDEEKLYEVYRRLVVYLTRQDPLRQYTEQNIKENLTATYGESIAFLERQKG